MSNIKINELIGVKIKSARQHARLSQKELGRILNLSDKAISSYEVGRAQPTIETLAELGKATHKPINYFFEPEDQENVDLQLKIRKIEQELIQIKEAISSKDL
ncbi:MAG: helix-turn-helix domain-containing protein [Patescibacteria group bacterium]